MYFIDEKATAYAEKYSSGEDPLLREIRERTAAEHPHAHMLSGHLQGCFLSQVSRMIAPRRILEIGTFVGYSALCLVKGLAQDGVLHTIECRSEDALRARNYFDRSPHPERIRLHVGDALDVVERLNETWDLVFIDADKVNYIRYYEAVLSRIRPGGWILADNVLFHGAVLEEAVKGKNAVAMDAFNRHVAADPRVEQVILTVRDGLSVIRKK